VRVGRFTDGYLPEPSDVTTPVRWLKEGLEQLGHVATIYAPHSTAGRRTMPQPLPLPLTAFSFPHGLTRRPPLQPPSGADVQGSERPAQPLPFLAGARRSGEGNALPHPARPHRPQVPAEYRHCLPRAVRPPKKTAEEASAASCDRCTAVTAPSTPIKEELLRHGGRSASSCSG